MSHNYVYIPKKPPFEIGEKVIVINTYGVFVGIRRITAIVSPGQYLIENQDTPWSPWRDEYLHKMVNQTDLVYCYTDETSMYSKNPNKRWVGDGYEETGFIEYPVELEGLSENELVEKANNEEDGVFWIDFFPEDL